MYLLLVLALGFLASQGMARHGRRYNANFRAIRVAVSLNLSTLASATHLKATMITTDNEMFIISTDLLWSVKGLTAGEGPLQVGIAHGDYSVTEIKEWFESSGSATTGNMIAQEQSKRRCRGSGVFNGLNTEETLNDGKPIRTKARFSIPDAGTVDMWVRNDSGATLTTGASVQCVGEIFVQLK